MVRFPMSHRCVLWACRVHGGLTAARLARPMTNMYVYVFTYTHIYTCTYLCCRSCAVKCSQHVKIQRRCPLICGTNSKPRTMMVLDVLRSHPSPCTSSSLSSLRDLMRRTYNL